MAFQNIKKIEHVLSHAVVGDATDKQIEALQDALIENRRVTDPHCNWFGIIQSDPRFSKTPNTLILVPKGDPRALTFPGLADKVA